MTPMTMDERIEAGLVAMMEAQASSVRRDQVRAILAAAFPELTGDKPQGWIAPRAPTEVMIELFVRRGLGRENSRLMWHEAMGAYLGKGEGG